ncbi:MAG: GGDEF domain-containing protein [Aquisalimonadaceae bacterium]
MSASRNESARTLRATLPRVAHGLSELDRANIELKVLRQLVAERGAKLDSAMHRINSLEAGNDCLEKQLQAMSLREAAALRRAYHDDLTGLPNRSLLMDRLSQALGRAQRLGTVGVAVLFIDLDGFKSVNDRYGHQVGDALLKQFARRLCNCLRATDTACRFGGDEFVVVLPDLHRMDAVKVVAGKIRAHLEKPFRVEQHIIPLAASAGWATYPDNGQDAHTLISQADAAMYRGKRDLARSRD